MRLVIVSDTHCTTPELPDGDILIHCGDMTYRGEWNESIAALNWFSQQPHKHKLYIAGNHELGWQNLMTRIRLQDIYRDITYLHDSSVEINGIKFWGSPYQPHFNNWAFQKARGAELEAHWEQIPDDTDVLITHGPPAGYGDINEYDDRFGDEDLLERVLQVKPKIHCYGHAHHGTGRWQVGNTLFVNAAVLTEQYKLTKKPTIIEYSST